MVKIDLTKELKDFYGASAKNIMVIDVPPMNFLMIDGKGDPSHSEQFHQAVEGLYSLSYTLKFMVKKGRAAVDYKVMPLEGLRRAEDMSVFTAGERHAWQSTLMIMQPEFVTPQLFEEALEQVTKKKNIPSLSGIRLESYLEGLAVQTLHLGPYSEEGPTIERLHSYAEENGYQLRGRHHEIYLGDPRRAAPEKLKTIIRQPIVKS